MVLPDAVLLYLLIHHLSGQFLFAPNIQIVRKVKKEFGVLVFFGDVSCGKSPMIANCVKLSGLDAEDSIVVKKATEASVRFLVLVFFFATQTVNCFEFLQLFLPIDQRMPQ